MWEGITKEDLEKLCGMHILDWQFEWLKEILKKHKEKKGE